MLYSGLLQNRLSNVIQICNNCWVYEKVNKSCCSPLLISIIRIGRRVQQIRDKYITLMMDVAKICNNHSFPVTEPQNWMNSPYFSPTPTPLMRVVREELGADSPLSSWRHGQKPSASRQIPKTRKWRSRWGMQAQLPIANSALRKSSPSLRGWREGRRDTLILVPPMEPLQKEVPLHPSTTDTHRSLHDDCGIIHSLHLDVLGFRHFTRLSFYS